MIVLGRKEYLSLRGCMTPGMVLVSNDQVLPDNYSELEN